MLFFNCFKKVSEEEKSHFQKEIADLRNQYVDVEQRIDQIGKKALDPQSDKIALWDDLQLLEKRITHLKEEKRTNLTLLTDSWSEKWFKQRINKLDRELSTTIDKLQNKEITIQQTLKREQQVKTLLSWTSLGLDGTTAKEKYESVQFLCESKLIYTIVGFQNTPSKEEELLLEEREDDLYIKKEGEFVSVSDLMSELEWSKEKQRIVNKQNPDECWIYLSPNGLTKQDRWNVKDMMSVHEISEEQMKELREHAQTFYHEMNPDPTPEETKDSVMQVFVSPRKYSELDDHPMLRGTASHLPIHVAMRLVKDGKVYSFGYEMFPEQQGYVTGSLFNMLSAADAKIAVLDYEEMREHQGRIVTSIPVTDKAVEEMLEMANEINADEPPTFNYLLQSCAKIAHLFLDKAGIPVNADMHGKTFIHNILPMMSNAPVLKHIIRPIRKLTQKIGSVMPNCVRNAFAAIARAFTYVPRKIGTFLVNVIVITLGGGKTAPGMHQIDKEKDNPRQKEGLARFSKVVRSFWDLFSEDLTDMKHPHLFIQWMLNQDSTAVHPYSGTPNLAIIPSQIEDEREADRRREYFYQKYCNWDR